MQDLPATSATDAARRLMTLFEGQPSALVALLQRMTAPEPTARPSAAAVSASSANSNTPEVPRSSRRAGHTRWPIWSRSSCTAKRVA